MTFPGGSGVKNLSATQEMQEIRVWSLGQEDPLEEEMQPTPVFLPGESHGQRSLVGYSPWDHKELDMTEHTVRYIFYMSSIKYICVWTHTRLKSVQSLSHVQLFATPRTAARPSPTPRAYSNSHPLSWWRHPTISSSVVPFSSRLQSFPSLGSFPMSQFFASGGQSVGVSALASVLPMTIQDWFPLGWIGWISLQSKGVSRVFSNTMTETGFMKRYLFFYCVMPSQIF